MSSEGTITGRDGELVVDGTRVARSTMWDCTTTLATKSEWGDSDSGGYTNRAAGRRDATFNAEGKYDTEDEVWDLFDIGDIASATLWLDNTSLYFHFPRALCMDFGVSVDMDTEEVIGWTSVWGADGIFYRPGASGAPAQSLS